MTSLWNLMLTCTYGQCLMSKDSLSQIKELRNHGDDVARELSLHGMSPDAVPNGRRGFEELLKLVRSETLYKFEVSSLFFSNNYCDGIWEKGLAGTEHTF